MRPTHLLLAGALAGCGWVDAPGDPIEMAHRAGAAFWPENSRTAVQGALEAGVAGIEVDLFLTADRVPVLVHDPYLSETLCTTAAGDPIEERVWLIEQDLATLQAGWLCGGKADPAYPDAEVVADTLMTLDELTEALEPYPEVVVQLDVKHWENVSHDPEVFAAEILERWWAADIENPMYLSGFSRETARALRSRGRAEGRPVEVYLTWPYFPPDSSDVAVAMGHELLTTAGFEDMLAAGKDADATGFDLPWQLVDRRIVETAKDEGYGIALWTVNGANLKQAFSRWPVDVIITDRPAGIDP